MPVNLKAALYVCFAAAAAVAIGRVCFPAYWSMLRRTGVAWVLVTILLFVSSQPAIFMLGAAVILASASPRDSFGRIAFFFALLPCAPPGIEWQLSAPGIERFIVLGYSQILALAVLLPLAFSKDPEDWKASDASGRESAAGRKIFALAAMYCILIVLLDFRETSLTNGLRIGLSHALTLGILLIALSKASRRAGLFEAAILGILAGGLFNLTIGLLQDRTHWLLYGEVSDNLRLYAIRSDLMMTQREGLRIPGSLTPIPYGIHMVLAATGALLLYWSGRATRWAIPLIGVFVYLTYRSGSRGAMLALAVALCVYMVTSPQLRRMRPAITTGFIVVASVLLFTDLFSKIVASDEHGTFAYRVDLVVNSMDSISNHPVLGTPKFLDNPVLQRSRQGEGLIDIVNTYLGVVLQYGLLGLLFFTWPLFASIRSVLGLRRASEQAGDSFHERTARTAAAVLIGYAAGILTVSLIDHLSHLYWLLIFSPIAGLSLGVERTAPAVAVSATRRARRPPGQRRRGTQGRSSDVG